jgi:hypothetical protein
MPLYVPISTQNAAEIINNLATSDPTKALSAMQGVALQRGKVFHGTDAPGAAPADAIDGDLYLRVGAVPFRFMLYKKGITTPGTWGLVENKSTWALRPSAVVANLGTVMLITDWGADFELREYAGPTYRWVPIGRMLLIDSFAGGAALNGDGVAAAPKAHRTFASPAGLLFAGCMIETEFLWAFTGSNDVRWGQFAIGGGVSAANLQATAAQFSMSMRKRVWVAASGSNGARFFSNSVSTADTSPHPNPVTTTSGDLTAAQTMGWYTQHHASDTAALAGATCRFNFPP